MADKRNSSTFRIAGYRNGITGAPCGKQPYFSGRLTLSWLAGGLYSKQSYMGNSPTLPVF